MCGICGKLELKVPVSPALIEEMCGRMAHRGPDDQGTYVKGNIGLGNRRLAIQDLSAAGHMPMSDRTGRLWITYNGEVYNFRELRQELEQKGHQFHSQTDTEVVLQAYQEWGPACLNRFNGMFALAIWDTETRQLFLARDRLGIKPLYYHLDGATLHFASETKVMLADPSLKREIDPRGMVNYFTFGHAVAPDTMLQRVKKLLPGHYMICSPREDGAVLELSVHRYWTHPLPVGNDKEDQGEEYYAEKVLQLLDQSVRRRLVADVPVGVFLSGGVDSSAITALVSSISTDRVKTFSIGFASGGSEYNELQDARRVATHFGTDHHEWLLSEQDLTGVLDDLVYQYDEPFGDSASFPTFLVSRLARTEVPVALSGEGADEIFGGYRRYVAEKFGGYYRRLPSALTDGLADRAVGMTSRSRRMKKALQVLGDKDPIRRYANWFILFNDEMRTQLFNDDLLEATSSLDSLEVYRQNYPANGVSAVGKSLYLDQQIWLPDTYLEKVDKASMAAGLEARVPFLDHELVEFAATIPVKYKVKGTTTKYILKRALKDLVPAATLKKPKHGFAVPTDLWFKGKLKGMVQELLLDSQSKCQQFFNPCYIEHLFEQHSTGKALYHRHLWLLVVFEIWCRRYGISA